MSQTIPDHNALTHQTRKTDRTEHNEIPHSCGTNKARKPWIQKRDGWPHRGNLWPEPPGKMVDERLEGKETFGAEETEQAKGQSSKREQHIFKYFSFTTKAIIHTWLKKNSSRRYTIKTKNLSQSLTSIHRFIPTFVWSQHICTAASSGPPCPPPNAQFYSSRATSFDRVWIYPEIHIDVQACIMNIKVSQNNTMPYICVHMVLNLFS